MGRTGDRLRCCLGGRDLLSHSGLRGPALNHAFSGLPVLGNNRSADGEGNEYTAIRCTRRPGQHDIPRIGIVDLMATTARGLAQRQFARLVESALRHNSLCAEVNIVNLDAASSWPRLAGTRADWDRIASFDALIVTGAEPKSTALARDPSFAIVEEILTVADSRAVSIVFSCLSAHAALDMLYSIPRHRLPEKRIGVLAHRVTADASTLTGGLPSVVRFPHSRWNMVHRSDLTASNVNPLMVTGTDDWGIATSPDGIRYVFLQGHPEYFADTLLREYRRDVRRFLHGEAQVYPTVPRDYLSSSSFEAAIKFSVHAKRNRSLQTAAAFPDMELDPGLGHAWEPSANVFAANWTSRVAGLVNA